MITGLIAALIGIAILVTAYLTGRALGAGAAKVQGKIGTNQAVEEQRVKDALKQKDDAAVMDRFRDAQEAMRKGGKR